MKTDLIAAKELVLELKNIVKVMDSRKYDIQSNLDDLDDKGSKAGKVTWTRLYESDDDVLRKIATATKRKQSEIIRILVHSAIKNKLVNEFTV